MAGRSDGTAVVVGPAGWRDVWGVWKLEQACFAGDAWGVLEILVALLAPGVRLKAMAGQQVVGFVLGEPHPDEHLAWIATLGVHPAWQRRGVGARLLGEAEGRLHQPRVKLTVREGNGPARSLYARAGYQEVQRVERYYSDGERGIVMEKQIRA